jgi:signal transduction histidine kinase
VTTSETNLLLIEDSTPDARLLEIYLQDGLPSASVEHERTLAGGLARLADGGVDAVLLDLGLPDSSGIDTFRAVAEAADRIAVVVITGLGDASLAQEAVALGAQDYLVKDAATADGLARAITYAITRQAALRDLEAARRAQLAEKDRFLSHVSHELRTPLAALHQFISLVADETCGPLNLDQRDCLDVAVRNIRQLAVMIDDLLAFGRFQSGKLALRIEPVAIGDLVEECATAFRLTAKERRVDLRTALGPLPVVACDPWRTREVVSNLLDNALKFTPEGGSVTVGADVDGNHVRVTVEDTGRGIKPENCTRVFEQFFQEGDGDTSGRTGLGIGLHLCREYVVRQGGEIRADCCPHGGARLTFTIPIADRPDEPAHPEQGDTP